MEAPGHPGHPPPLRDAVVNNGYFGDLTEEVYLAVMFPKIRLESVNIKWYMAIKSAQEMCFYIGSY